MNQFIVDRIQTGGAGNLNIPTEKVYELGNYQSVAIVRDVPDLTFNLDCLDVGVEVEQILSTGVANNAAANGTAYDLSISKPVDIVSPFKSAQGAFDTVRGIAVPQLSLESASYRYGLRQNAGEQFSLKGDSIFYVPGTPYQNRYTGDGVRTSFPFVATGTEAAATPSPLTAVVYKEQGKNIYALNVSVNGVRQYPGEQYTETASGVTFAAAPPSNALVSIVFGSLTSATYGQNVHEGVSVKPAAIRGKDIQVFLTAFNQSTGAVVNRKRWTDVQSVNIDWRVRLEDDFEFGNPRAISREFADTPQVTGSVEFKPLSPQAWHDKLRDITGVPASEIIGPQSSVFVGLEVQLTNPDSGGATNVAPGSVLKTLWVPDARFVMPGYEGRAQQKVVASMNFESDGGLLTVHKGSRA